MTELSFFCAIAFLFFVSGAGIGYKIGKGHRRKLPPTPLHRSLSSIAAADNRANRMHGILDGWSLAHRTDSEA